MATARNVMSALAALGAVVGCGSTSTDVGRPALTSRASSGTSGAAATSIADDAPLTATPCREAACMVHPRTGLHHRCLHGADGHCFTFGAPCLPTGGG